MRRTTIWTAPLTLACLFALAGCDTTPPPPPPGAEDVETKLEITGDPMNDEPSGDKPSEDKPEGDKPAGDAAPPADSTEPAPEKAKDE